MHTVPMASQSRQCRKPTLARSGSSNVTKVDARLMALPWHQKRTVGKEIDQI